jgi:hypothetical protein
MQITKKPKLPKPRPMLVIYHTALGSKITMRAAAATVETFDQAIEALRICRDDIAKAEADAKTDAPEAA